MISAQHDPATSGLTNQINDLTAAGRHSDALEILREELALHPNDERLRDLALRVLGAKSVVARIFLAPRRWQRFTRYFLPAVLTFPLLWDWGTGTRPANHHLFSAAANSNVYVPMLYAWGCFVAWAGPLTDLYLLSSPKRAWVLNPLDALAARCTYISVALVVLALVVSNLRHASAPFDTWAYAIWGVAAVCLLILRRGGGDANAAGLLRVVGITAIAGAFFALAVELIR